MTWSAAARAGLVTPVVSEAVLALAAAAWAVVLVVYVAGRRRSGAPAGDLFDPVLAPFVSLAPIVAMVLASAGLAPHAPEAGRVAFDGAAVVTVALGGWLTGQWIYGSLPIDGLHPGYFLPTVAGGLLAAEGAAAVGQAGLGRLLFGLGLVCWMILGSMILGRLFFGPSLPAPLRPTLAIEVAPAAVAVSAWWALHGATSGVVVTALTGYGLLMILAQVRLLPMYVRLPFTMGFWWFTFSWSAVATATIQWIAIESPGGAEGLSWAVLVAVSALVVGIAGRTVVGLRRGTFLPPAARPGSPDGSPGGCPALGTSWPGPGRAPSGPEAESLPSR